MRYAIIGIALSIAPAAMAQNTSGVAGPVIDPDDRAWEYRATFDPDDDGLKQRLHYQQAINGEMRWRVVGQLRDTDDSDFDADFVRAELVWQVTPDDQKYQSGFRFDARYRFDDRPADLAVHWLHQWKHIENWTLRFEAIATKQVSNGPADGVLVQTRGSATTKLAEGPKLGVEWFGSLGSTSDWRDLDEQTHEIGPVAVWGVNDNWDLSTGVLFGVTDVSPDSQLRLKLTRKY
ncbi:MAG: hypothetical protein NXH78_04495 [Hyphomonadaceae bacterium]|nr:hypothetical protein [Hyphomonadaceae bacterium]